MTTTTRLIAAALLLGGLNAFPPVRAAESYDACAGFIDSIPTTITTQGVWCLRKDLSTAITSGNAITIATNNVTIDCNDFKLGGLAAGNGSSARGIYAENRQNATVRNCNIRGFNHGILLSYGAGHLVEDNRLDNNLLAAINVMADNSRIRRNAVYDTGGRTGAIYTYGIQASADIIDNTVAGLFADAAGGELYGILAYTPGAQVRDNTVSGFDMVAVQGGAVATVYGIIMINGRMRASGNNVHAGGGTNGFGIWANNYHACIDNTVSGFATSIHPNCNSSGNVTW